MRAFDTIILGRASLYRSPLCWLCTHWHIGYEGSLPVGYPVGVCSHGFVRGPPNLLALPGVQGSKRMELVHILQPARTSARLGCLPAYRTYLP